MFSNSQLRGTGVALITPFKQDKSIDFDAMKRVIDFNIENGVNYFIILGTTGESPVLTKEEKHEVFGKAAEFVNGRVPLVAGVGGNSTVQVIDDMRSFAHREQYCAFLSVTPYYNKPSQQGMIEHYGAIAAMSPLPIILYNVPGRTGVTLQPATVIHLANAHKNIIGVKEAAGSMSASFELLRDRPAGFLLLSGDDDLTFPQIACGFDGVISVAAQSFPKPFCKMVQDALAGNTQQAAPIQLRLIKGINLLFKEGNPVGVKLALAQMGLCENVLRLPLISASPALSTEMQEFIHASKDLL
jgi:4-hydroxy-tetrahydrodipicolinate synthase